MIQTRVSWQRLRHGVLTADHGSTACHFEDRRWRAGMGEWSCLECTSVSASKYGDICEGSLEVDSRVQANICWSVLKTPHLVGVDYEPLDFSANDFSAIFLVSKSWTDLDTLLQQLRKCGSTTVDRREYPKLLWLGYQSRIWKISTGDSLKWIADYRRNYLIKSWTKLVSVIPILFYLLYRILHRYRLSRLRNTL